MSRKHPRPQFRILDVLIVFVPISFLLYYLHVNVILTFLVVAAAIAGLTYFIAESTNIIARRVSNTISALLNATFGNVVEFFVAFFALREGLVNMVKASIVGSVIVNVLLLIGLSMLAGGLKYKEQKFNRDSAGLYSTMLIVVVVGLAMPSIYSMVAAKPAFTMSIAVSIILGIIYLLSLIYTLVTHKHLFEVERHGPEEKEGRWSLRWAALILLAATALVSLESSLLVETVTPLINQISITEAFMGMVVIALLTNIPEHISAMSFARRNNMTLSLEIGMASALQITLFVVPLLVAVSYIALGSALDLVFTPFELVALVATVMVANYISSDGVCHWLEGAQLVAVYLIIAIAFFFI